MTVANWSEARDGQEWDDFVVRNGGSIFHRWAWRKILENSNLRPFYLICRDREGRVIGICPLVMSSDRRFRHLVSPPNTPMSGPVLKGDEADVTDMLRSLSKSVRFSLFDPIVALHISVHQQFIIQPMISLGFQSKVEKYGLLMTDISKHPPIYIWSEGFGKHDRQAVKFYENLNCEFRFSNQESDYANILALSEGHTWDPYNRSDYFSNLRLNLGNEVTMGLATINGELIAGILALADPWASAVHLMAMRYSLVRNIHSPVTYINWKMISWAADKGFRNVNFGPWLKAHIEDSAHPAFKTRKKFEACFMPRYTFTVRPSDVVYSLARKVRREVMRLRRVSHVNDPRDQVG